MSGLFDTCRRFIFARAFGGERDDAAVDEWETKNGGCVREPRARNRGARRTRTGLARALVEKGKSLVAPLLEQVRDESVDDPAPSMFREAADMFEAAIGLDPENTEAEGEMEKLLDVLEEEEPTRPPPNHDDPLDVVIVGAGASGIGLGIMLTRTFNLDPERVLIIDRGEVGESFLRWPREMRHLTLIQQPGMDGQF